MLKIIISLDYEIFGDGSGDVMKHMIKPTETLLSICDQTRNRMTIMLEMMEYIKFREYDKALVASLGYSPYKMIQTQVLDAYRRGHDVQLHVHPQWYYAEFRNGQWLMDNPYISFEQIEMNEIYDMITLCKAELESLICSVDMNYQPVAIRLTNLPWTQPPKKAVEVISQLGFKIHSLAMTTSKNNTEDGYWHLSDTLVELPILAFSVPSFKKYTFGRIMTGLYRKSIMKNDVTAVKSKANSRNIFSCNYDLKWDFCKQSFKEMRLFLDKASRHYNSDIAVPLVMIGHSKDFFNSRAFRKFTEMVNTSTFNEFSTLLDKKVELVN